jgi:hypothetical protein
MLKNLIPYNTEDFFKDQITYLAAMFKCQQVNAMLFYVIWIAEKTTSQRHKIGQQSTIFYFCQ